MWFELVLKRIFLVISRLNPTGTSSLLSVDVPRFKVAVAIGTSEVCFC